MLTFPPFFLYYFPFFMYLPTKSEIIGLNETGILYIFLYYYLLILGREEGRKREKEKYWSVFLPIYAFIGCFFYVPWSGIEPATLVYWGDILTNGAT